MSYNREDKKLLNDAFAELMAKTQDYCDFVCQNSLYDAVFSNSKFFTLAPKLFHPLLNEMDEALQNSNTRKVQSIRKSLMELFSTNT